jgi:putative membrane protein
MNVHFNLLDFPYVDRERWAVVEVWNAEAESPRQGTEPDARFTLANERTFLAWNRTALALVAAGLAIVQLLPPFAGVPWGRHLIAVPLIVTGGVISVMSYLEWRRDQRALRLGQPLPRSVLPRLLAGTISTLAAVAAILVLLSQVLK